MLNKAKFKKQRKAMLNKAIELGFKNSLEAENAGFGVELKKAFDNEKYKQTGTSNKADLPSEMLGATRFVKGSKAAKNFMAKLRAQRSIGGWAKGNTRMIEMDEKPFKKLKNVRVKRKKDGVFKEFRVLPKVSKLALMGINYSLDKRGRLV